MTARGSFSSIAAHHGVAQKAIRDGDLRQAHQHCLAILAIDPDFADAWFLCGVIAARNGAVDKSVDIFRKAIGPAPDKAEYHPELGKQLIALREPREALTAAATALSLSPTELPILNTLGLYLYTNHAAAPECLLYSSTGQYSSFSRWVAAGDGFPGYLEHGSRFARGGSQRRCWWC